MPRHTFSTGWICSPEHVMHSIENNDLHTSSLANRVFASEPNHDTVFARTWWHKGRIHNVLWYESLWLRMVIPDQLHHKTCVLQHGPSGSNAARRCDVHPHLWLARSDSMSHRSCFFRWATHLYGLICGWFVVDLYHFQYSKYSTILVGEEFWPITHVSLSGKWPLKIIGGPATKQATPN